MSGINFNGITENQSVNFSPDREKSPQEKKTGSGSSIPRDEYSGPSRSQKVMREYLRLRSIHSRLRRLNKKHKTVNKADDKTEKTDAKTEKGKTGKKSKETRAE